MRITNSSQGGETSRGASCLTSAGRVTRAVTRFFVKGGGHEPWCGGSGGLLSQKIVKFGGSETLFSALVVRYVSEKSTSNNGEKAGVFSAYNIISDFPAMKMANKCKSLQSK